MSDLLQNLRYYFAPVIVALLTGCAQNAVYHDSAPKPENCIGDLSSESCTKSYYQYHENFDLAFAEFSERGNVFNDQYIDNVLKQIRSHAAEAEKGIVLVAFIHGWKHNASEDDDILIAFKESLDRISSDKKMLDGRKLIGLYLGWRGASVEVPGLKELTFWDRKAVAEEVGAGGGTQLLLELEKIDESDDKNNVVVIIGHSFGGAIVVRALTDVMTERVVDRTKGGKSAGTIGDAVIVLNPAIEANQTLHLVEAALENDFPEGQHPLFVSISTDADGPTHRLFPIGQTIGLSVTWRQTDLVRSYYYDRLQGEGEPLVLKEEHLDTTTVGNFAPFLTHRLNASSDPHKAEFSFQPCHRVPDQCVPRGLTSLIGQPTIKNLPENYPLFFIKTDENVMEGHGDIFNLKIQSFLLAIIDDVVRRKKDPHSAPTILSNSDRLESVSGDYFKKLYCLNNENKRKPVCKPDSANLTGES